MLANSINSNPFSYLLHCEVIDNYFARISSELDYLNNLDRNLTSGEFWAYNDLLQESLRGLQLQAVLDLLTRADVLRLIGDTIELSNFVLYKSPVDDLNSYWSRRSVWGIWLVLNAKRDVLVEPASREFRYSSSLIRITLRKIDMLQDTEVVFTFEADDVQLEIPVHQIDLNYTEEGTASSLMVVVYDYTLKSTEREYELKGEQTQLLAPPTGVYLNGQRFEAVALVPPNKAVIRYSFQFNVSITIQINTTFSLE